MIILFITVLPILNSTTMSGSDLVTEVIDRTSRIASHRRSHQFERRRRGKFPYNARLMRCYPVSTRINRVANDDEECSAPVEVAETLFS
jgi:hypothetical protein